MPSQTNNQPTNGPDTPDLSAFGIAPSGEPAEAVQPLGRRVASFPFKQRIDFRVGKGGKPLLKDLLDGSRNTAAWVQTRGIQVSQPCASCASGNGPFSSCVVFRTANGQRFCEGSCANCYFGHKPTRCSFRVSSPDLPRASLLQQFQSARPNPEPQIQRELQSSVKTRPAPPGDDLQPSKKHQMDSFSSSADVPLFPLFVPTASTAKPRSAGTDSGSANGSGGGSGGILTESVSGDPRRPRAASSRAPSIPPEKSTTALSRRSSRAKPFAVEGEVSRSPSEIPNGELMLSGPPQSKTDSINLTNDDGPSTKTTESSQRRVTQAKSNNERTQSSAKPAIGATLRNQLLQPLSDSNDTDLTKGNTSAYTSENTKTARPNSSKDDENVIPCPLTPTMYSDSKLLRLAVKDLSKFLHVAEKRLKELEEPEVDVWGMAIAKLDK